MATILENQSQANTQVKKLYEYLSWLAAEVALVRDYVELTLNQKDSWVQELNKLYFPLLSYSERSQDGVFVGLIQEIDEKISVVKNIILKSGTRASLYRFPEDMNVVNRLLTSVVQKLHIYLNNVGIYSESYSVSPRLTRERIEEINQQIYEQQLGNEEPTEVVRESPVAEVIEPEVIRTADIPEAHVLSVSDRVIEPKPLFMRKLFIPLAFGLGLAIGFFVWRK